MSPYFQFDIGEADRLLDEFTRLGASVTLLALGAPRQGTFAARGRTRLPQIGFVSIGEGLDFLTGSQVRGSRWMRRLAGRYARCALLLPRLVVMALRQRGTAEASGN